MNIQNILDMLIKKWDAIILIMVICIFVLFVIGYFMKGIWGFAFDLNSCWTGMAAVSTGSITGLGKYFMDSKWNSKPGEMP